MSITKVELHDAMDDYVRGKRPPNLGLVRSWFIVDERTGAWYPLKAIWALVQGVPAKTFKTNVAVAEIKRLPFPVQLVKNAEEFDPRPFANAVAASSKDSPADRRQRIKNATTKPDFYYAPVKVYLRNPDIVAEARYLAKGKCGGCGNPAPFNQATNGNPYLEVHHKIPLAKGGADSMDNVIALCPNCHRKAHYG